MARLTTLLPRLVGTQKQLLAQTWTLCGRVPQFISAIACRHWIGFAPWGAVVAEAFFIPRWAFEGSNRQEEVATTSPRKKIRFPSLHVRSILVFAICRTVTFEKPSFDRASIESGISQGNPTYYCVGK